MVCVICKQAHLRPGKGTSVFERNGMTLVVKDVPKLVCPNCDEEYTDEDITEQVLQIVEEAERTSVLTDVRRYTAA